MRDKFEQINKLILNSHSILLLTHPKPDGDAIGSTGALIGYLRSLQKSYLAFCQDSVPPALKYLPWSWEIKSGLNFQPASFQPDLVICLDLTEWQRAGLEGLASDLLSPDCHLVVLDHHQPKSVSADVSIVEPSYSSTAELVYEFFTALGLKIDQLMARCLLTGILTDTENLTNPAVKHQTLLAAAELVRQGADLTRLTQKIWRQRSLAELRLFGLALARLRYNFQLGLAVTLVKESELEQFATGAEPLGGLTNFLKGLKDGLAVLFLLGQSDKIKGSLRSIDHRVDVAKLARVLGGGGHKLAAGFTINGRLEQVNGEWQVV